MKEETKLAPPMVFSEGESDDSGMTPGMPTEMKIQNVDGTALRVQNGYADEKSLIFEIALHLYYNAYQQNNSVAPKIAVDCMERAKTFVEIAKNNGLIAF